MKFLSLTFFVFVSLHAVAQANYALSLSKVTIHTDTTDFQAHQVLDGRRQKPEIGWVQTGMSNRRRVAELEAGFDGEILSLFKRSGLLSETPVENPLILVITRLYINEETQAMSETGKAELAINFFKKLNAPDSVQYLKTVFIEHENSGMDVTHKHDDRIAEAFGQAIDMFKQRMQDQARTKILHVSQITNPEVTMRDASSIPILQATTYTDGVFRTYDDFANNITTMEKYSFKIGKGIKVFHINKDKTKTRVRNGIFGFAYAGKLYVVLDGHEYELSRDRDHYSFIGPMLANSAAMAGGAVGGLIGAAIAGAMSSDYRVQFQIDWDLERINEIGIIRN